ncbi:MAG: hypothetical protein ACRD1Y_02945 [Terriglobales bacterium]
MTKEPIPMPSREPTPERVARLMGQWLRRTRVQSHRVMELLRAAGSAEGRRRHVLPLMLLSAATGALVGFALGWRRR